MQQQGFRVPADGVGVAGVSARTVELALDVEGPAARRT